MRGGLKSWVYCLAALVVMSQASAQTALRDPTRPPGMGVTMATSGQNIKLQAIFYNKSKPSVLIGGRYYYEGDVYNGSVLTKIKRDDVILSGADGEVVVGMYPSIRRSVKKNADATKKGNND